MEDVIGTAATLLSPWPKATTQLFLRIAVRRVGRKELALALECSPRLLDGWISGRAAMPGAKLNALIDILGKVPDTK